MHKKAYFGGGFVVFETLARSDASDLTTNAHPSHMFRISLTIDAPSPLIALI